MSKFLEATADETHVEKAPGIPWQINKNQSYSNCSEPLKNYLILMFYIEIIYAYIYYKNVVSITQKQKSQKYQ